MLVLEKEEHALARGAKIYCELAGYGSSGDAEHVTTAREDGKGAAQAMLAALNDAGVDGDQVCENEPTMKKTLEILLIMSKH